MVGIETYLGPCHRDVFLNLAHLKRVGQLKKKKHENLVRRDEPQEQKINENLFLSSEPARNDNSNLSIKNESVNLSSGNESVEKKMRFFISEIEKNNKFVNVAKLCLKDIKEII